MSEPLQLVWMYGGASFLFWGFLYLMSYVLKLRKGGGPITYSDLFQTSLIFLVLLSCLWSIIQTKGWTLQWLFIPLIAAYVYYGKGKHTEAPKKQANPIHLFLLGGFCFLWCFFSLINFGGIGFYLPDGLSTQENDFFIYAQRAKALGTYGQENYFALLNELDEAYQGLSPYHYLELWLSSFFSEMLGVNHVFSLGIIVKASFYFITGLGFLALLEKWGYQGKWESIALALAFFFLSGIYLKISFLSLPEFNLSALSYRTKMMVYYPFFIGFVLNFLNHQKERAFLMLAMLMLATVVSIPAILGATLLMGLWGEQRKDRSFRKPLIIIVLSAAAVLLFYALSPSPQLSASMGVERQELLAYLSFSHLFKSLGAFILHILGLIPIFLLPFCLIFLAYKASSDQGLKDVLLFSLMIILSGAAAYALLGDFENAIQLFFNPVIVCLNTGAILALIYLWKDRASRIWMYVILGASFLNQLFILPPKLFSHHIKSHYSPDYLEEIKTLADTGKLSGMGGALKAEEDYFSPFSKITYAYTGAYYLQYFPGEIDCISLSDHQIKINPNNQRNNLVNRNSGIFYQYVLEQKSAGSFQSIPQSQLSFLQKHKINFLVLSKNVTLDPALNLRVKRKIRDTFSGEQFLLIDTQ